jgi:Holliday junction resolvase RusA-like endonuclease
MAIEGRELFTMPVRVDMTFCYGNGGADLDNLVKAVLDALNGVVWEDDVQVVSMSARIHRGCPKDQRQVSIGVEALSTN